MSVIQHFQLKLPFVILLLSHGLTGLQAQTMYLKENNGAYSAYGLSNISKLSFSNGNLIVSKDGGSSDSYAITNVRYLNFVDLSTAVITEKESDSQTLTLLFPNPVNDILNIRWEHGKTDRLIIEIISMEGKVVYKEVINSQANVIQLQLSALPEGLYLCRINNGKILEIIKFLKQKKL